MENKEKKREGREIVLEVQDGVLSGKCGIKQRKKVIEKIINRITGGQHGNDSQ